MSNVNETPYMIGRRIAAKTMDAIATNTDYATSSVTKNYPGHLDRKMPGAGVRQLLVLVLFCCWWRVQGYVQKQSKLFQALSQKP